MAEETLPDVAAAIDSNEVGDSLAQEDEEEVVTNLRSETDRSLKISVTPSGGAGNGGDNRADTDRSSSKLTVTDNSRQSVPLLKSTLKKQQRSWIDPYEPAIQDTFYHKELKQLRPNFENVQMAIVKMDTELHQLFDQGPSTMRNRGNDGNGDYDDDVDVDSEQKLEDEELDAADNKEVSTKASKFGAWDGVFTGCILNIFGVIMFLRLGYIVGQAGIVQAVIIILISSLVTFLTSLSMSAICTNGTILGGGAYYIISRSLGPSLGGAVGVLFSIGNMVAVAMYLIGFAETLVDNLPGKEPMITGDFVNDVRIWANVVLIFELVLALVGLKYVIKANLGLLALITVTIICFFVGSFYRTGKGIDEDGEKVKVLFAASGWTNGNLGENMSSGYEDGFDFWGVLAIFFPAVTGIMAGANISGDLKNPSEDIPKGTLAAVGLSTVVYSIMAIFVGAVTARTELLDNYTVMADICVWEPIVLAGIYAATLSSGIAALVGAPRILQAVAQDNIIPGLSFFAVTDKEGNPIRGYFLSFGVAAACNCIGQLNFIAELISEFFMIAYLMINFACFAMEISKSPGWRPAFKYFNAYTAFSGFLLCLIIMFLISWQYALIASGFSFSIFAYISWSEPDVKWGSAQASRAFYEVYKAMLRLKSQKLHIKNWRPAILCLTSDPVKKPQLVMFCQTLKKSYGPFFFGTVYTGDYRVNIQKFHRSHNNGYLPPILRSGFQQGSKKKFCKGFYEPILADNFRSGCQNLFQLVGLGNLRPNTIMMGFKTKWNKDETEVISEYVQVLRDALQMRMGLILCAGFEKINWTHHEFVPSAVTVDYEATDDESYKPSRIIQGANNNNNSNDTDAENDDGEDAFGMRTQSENIIAMRRTSDWVQAQALPIIDVWWLLDDGGLMLLIPHIMRQHSFWQGCKLRMNLVAERDDISTDVQVVEDLINRFRLPFEKPRVILVDDNEPTQKTKNKFATFSGGIKVEETPRPSVTRRWLKLSELLFEHSRYAGMVIVTLPLPTATLNSRAYMSLLHCMCDQNRMPPMLIMRGNGESSLTFYSE